jgi:soluble lytic murein transglycosylase-like protein
VDFIDYLFWGGLVLALSAAMLAAGSGLMAKVQAPLKSARLRISLSIGASMLAGVIILSAGLVAAKAFLPYAPSSQRVPDRVQPDRVPGEGTPPFGRWDEESLPAGAKQDFSRQIAGVASLSATACPQPWPHAPPKIGKLELKQENWEYIKEAAQRYHISPYLIQAVCAIESRYDPYAKSGRCRGLMQLHQDTAKKYGVNPHNPRENIMAGAAVLASLLQRYDGDLRRVLRKYNASCTSAYEREVIRAYNQAKQFEIVSLPPKKSKN